MYATQLYKNNTLSDKLYNFYKPLKNNTGLKVFIVTSVIFSFLLGGIFSIQVGTLSLGICIFATCIYLLQNKQKPIETYIEQPIKTYIQEKTPKRKKRKNEVERRYRKQSFNEKKHSRRPVLEASQSEFSRSLYDSIYDTDASPKMLEPPAHILAENTDFIPRNTPLSKKEKRVIKFVKEAIKNRVSEEDQMKILEWIRSEIEERDSYKELFEKIDFRMDKQINIDKHSGLLLEVIMSNIRLSLLEDIFRQRRLPITERIMKLSFAMAPTSINKVKLESLLQTCEDGLEFVDVECNCEEVGGTHQHLWNALEFVSYFLNLNGSGRPFLTHPLDKTQKKLKENTLKNLLTCLGIKSKNWETLTKMPSYEVRMNSFIALLREEHRDKMSFL